MNLSNKNEFYNCEITGVYRRLDFSRNSYMIAIRVNDTKDGKIEISFDGPSLAEKLQELLTKKDGRVYASYGMTDIDFFYADYKKRFAIEWSPCDSIYKTFYFSKKQFTTLVNAIKFDN